MAHPPMSSQIRVLRDHAVSARRRTAVGLLAAAGVGFLVAGCAYDPSTGTYVPCCAAPTYAYAAPYAAAPPAPGPPVAQGPAPGQYAPGQYQQPPGPYQDSSVGQYPYPEGRPEAPPPGAGRGQPHLAQRFARANVTGDGRLTFQQAQQAHWQVVVRNFAAIDVQQKGYATLDDIRSWMATRRQTYPTQSG